MWILKAFLGFPSKVKLWFLGAGGVAALLAFLKAYIFFWKKSTAKEAVQDFKDEQAAKDVEVRKNAKKLVAKEKREADRLPDSDVADRLRRRSDDWDRL